MSDSAFRPLTQIEKIFKDLVWDPMVKSGEVWVEGAVPVLNLPLLKQLDEAVMERLSNAVYEQICTWVDIGAIKLVDAQHDKAFKDASLQLLLIAHAHGADSPEFKKANEDAKAALAAFVRHSVA